MLDEETGLYYYGARYYDPELGRFIQPRPLEEPWFQATSSRRLKAW